MVLTIVTTMRVTQHTKLKSYNMKEGTIYRKYWYMWLIIILLPFALYWLIKQPCGFDAIGGKDAPSDWLGFWGGYIGAVISASVAFIILSKQIKQSRSLFQKQIEQQRLAELRKACAEYMAATNCNKFVAPLNNLLNNPEDVFESTKRIIDEEYLPFMTLKLLQEDNIACDYLFRDIVDWRNKFIFAIKNIHITSCKIIDSRRNNTDLRSDIENETKYKGVVFHAKIKHALDDDGTTESYEKRVIEVHRNEHEWIKPDQEQIFERMHHYINYKEDIINQI